MKKEIEIYTDGACIGNGNAQNIGGWSFVVVEKGNLLLHSVGTAKNTTNNRQEMLAVLNSLLFCLENDVTDFTLYCDSQYVILGLTKWMDGWVKRGFKRGKPAFDIPNADLWKQLNYVKNQFDTLDLQWVRGHSGNKWNEFADQLIEKEMSKDPDFNNLSKKSYSHAKKTNNS